MPIVYFDRNVFAEICDFRNDFTQNDFDIIKKAVDSKQILIPLSSALLAETSAILQKSGKDFLKHLRTVFSIISKERMIKRNDDLLRDDCMSFAHLSPFQRTVPLSVKGKNFIESPKINSTFLQLAINHPQSMQTGAKNINDTILFYKQNLENSGLQISSDFVKFWNEHSIKTVKRLINELPENEKRLCEKHGIEKMLEIRSIRLYTVYHAWIFYSGLHGVQGNPRILKSNDFMDFIHTIEASGAEIFVTQENKNKANKLPYIINQITFKNFKTMNLKEFLLYLQRENINK